MAFPKVEDLQIDYTQNPFIQRSFEYYKNLDKDDKELINAYKAEMDASDWADKPLDITYTVINWILYHKAIPMRNTPNLLKEHALTKKQFVKQIEYAHHLVDILSNFPRIEGRDNGITVFRGETTRLGEYIKSKKEEISIYSFLSTTVNLEVATAFSKGILLVIHIPAGNPLPFISDHVSLNYRKGPTSSESEVLLSPGSTFVINRYIDNVEVLEKKCDVFYLTLLRLGPHDTRGLWNRYTKNTNTLYNELSSKLKQNNMNKMIVNRSMMRGQGHKKRNKTRKIKNKNKNKQ
jgi:hypothetical protein